MAQEGESGAAVHLPLDHLRFGVHALGPAVMERQGDGGGDGRHVEVQATGEGVDAWQVCGARGADPFLELGSSLPGSGVSRAAKERTRPARLVISGQAAVSLLSSDCWRR